MKVNKIQIVGLSLWMVIGVILLILGIIKHEIILLSPGLVIILSTIKSIISLRKLHKGNKDELDRQRAAKDERILMIWEKAALVSFWVAFIALMVTAFIYLIVLDMFWEGLVVFAIFWTIMISFVISVWYYSKKY